MLNKELQEQIRPDENLMFDRKGFDRRSLRRELAGTEALAPGQKFITQGNAYFVHPDSDMPTGPAGIGESFGNVEVISQTGFTVQIPRYINGMMLDVQDYDIPAMSRVIRNKRDAIMELFDIQADLAFYNGLVDQAGNQIFLGVFEWLEANMDAGNVIDCSEFVNGGARQGELGGVPANVILDIAYGLTENEYADDMWEVAVARKSVWAKWNAVGTADYNMNRSQWQLINADDVGVGVQRRMNFPLKIGLRAPDGMAETLRFDLSFPTATSADDSLGSIPVDDDVMYLIPRHNGDFYYLVEETTPSVRGPLEKDGWKERWEYSWKAGVVQGMSHRAGGGAPDVVKLENVEALFVGDIVNTT